VENGSIARGHRLLARRRRLLVCSPGKHVSDGQGDRMDVLAIQAIGPNLSADARAALAEADVIIGVDVAGQREFTVFGTPELEDSGSVKKPVALRTVRVFLDCAAGDLDELLALVQIIKGLKLPGSVK
jgi:hypothetical protein